MLSSLLPARTVVFAERADIPLSFSETLPDYLPDIRRILGAECRILRTSASEEETVLRVIADGSIEIIYAAEGKGHIKSAVFPFTLDKTFRLPPDGLPTPHTIRSSGYVCTVTALETAKRTLNCRGNAVLDISVICDTLTDLGAFRTDGICTRDETVSAVKRQTFAGSFEKEEDIVLDADMPPIAEVGQTRFSVTNGRCRVDGDTLLCDADLTVHTVYRAEAESPDDDADYVYITKVLPLSAELRADDPDKAPAADALIIPHFDVTKGDISVSFDNYGENRLMRLTAAFSVSAECITGMEVSYASDAFCPGKDSETSIGIHTFQTLMAPIMTELHTVETVGAEIAKLQTINDTALRLCSENIENCDGKPCFVGKAVLSVSGSGIDGMPVILSKQIVLRVPIPSMPPLAASEHAVFDAEIVDCTASVRAGDIAADITLAIRGALLDTQKITCVDEIRIGQSAHEHGGDAAYIFCYPDEKQELFDIAKHYDVTPECIRDANGLKGDEIGPGSVLLIPHFV